MVHFLLVIAFGCQNQCYQIPEITSFVKRELYTFSKLSVKLQKTTHVKKDMERILQQSRETP